MGFPVTDGLMSPPKDTKVKVFFFFFGGGGGGGRAECTQKTNESLLQVGLEPWTFQSTVQCFNQ